MGVESVQHATVVYQLVARRAQQPLGPVWRRGLHVVAAWQMERRHLLRQMEVRLPVAEATETLTCTEVWVAEAESMATVQPA